MRPTPRTRLLGTLGIGALAMITGLAACGTGDGAADQGAAPRRAANAGEANPDDGATTTVQARGVTDATAPRTSSSTSAPAPASPSAERRPKPAPGQPSLLTQPGAAEPGQEVVATLAGFEADSYVVIEVRPPSQETVLSFDIRVDGTGAATAPFLVPGPTPPGEYLVIATSGDRTRTDYSDLTVLPSSNCAPDQQPQC